MRGRYLRDMGDDKTVVVNQHELVDESEMEPGGSDMAILVMLRGPKVGQKVQLNSTTDELSIGRDDEAGLSIDDESASRQHCRLSFMNENWFIEDLQSTNGTYVGGHPIDRVPLRDGDLIKVGATIFKFLSARNIEAAYHEEIYRMAIYDGLTQIHNRRFLEEFLEREMSRCRRHERALSVILFDVDDFKQINDRYGHLSGDHVLRTISNSLARRVRREELLARFGGDEFVMVLPESAPSDAMKFAELIREHIENMECIFDDWNLPVTVSLGVAGYTNDMNSPSDILSAADAALYRAKNNGRNQVAL